MLVWEHALRAHLEEPAMHVLSGANAVTGALDARRSVSVKREIAMLKTERVSATPDTKETSARRSVRKADGAWGVRMTAHDA